MATAETKLSMKLLIDTKAKKVLYVEVEKDFDFGALHEEVHFGTEEALKLLKLSFESKAVLTSLFTTRKNTLQSLNRNFIKYLPPNN
ncbi:hypothetical protein RND71_010362 [Anisodus tanguticus]|uniref:Uncharacterized protein n=1 Tax=Anisodus tanguticus TaxID=243964 RepID=A0AAE1SJE6_9SOLA|nr:hypothetical protein RND71_010362 [Anisodus tanguticus]